MATFDDYTGWKKWFPTDDEWAEFEVCHEVPFGMLENEYLLVYGVEEGETKLFSQWKYYEGKLHKVGRSSIRVEQEKPAVVEQEPVQQKRGRGTQKPKTQKSAKQNDKAKIFTPRNDEQICAFDMMKDDNTTVKLITGGFGTGKTMILVAAALEQLKAKKFEKIIWLRNNVRVKGTEDLGALPGEVNEKLLPYLGPFIDHVGEAATSCMLSNGHLTIEPLQSVRGRNFENSIIICSEAENLSFDDLMLIMGRVADGSVLYIDGDVRQRDKAIYEKSRGLEGMIDCLKGNPLFGYVKLMKTERSKTAALADLLDKYKDTHPSVVVK